MPVKAVSPYGSWASPITADIIVAGGLSFSEIRVDGDDVYWLEGRSAEAGRSVVVRRSIDGEEWDQIPAGSMLVPGCTNTAAGFMLSGRVRFFLPTGKISGFTGLRKTHLHNR